MLLYSLSENVYWRSWKVFFGEVVHKVRSTERHWVPYGLFMRGNYQLLAHGVPFDSSTAC